MAQLEAIGCSMLDVGCWMFSFGSWVQCANFSGNSLPPPDLPPPHEPLGTSNIQHPTPNRQSMAQLETIGCSMLDVGCWMFSFGSWVQCANFSGNSLPPPDLPPPHEPLGTSNIQHPTPNCQSMGRFYALGCSMLDVGCWMFSFGSWVQCANFSGKSLPVRLAALSRRRSGRGEGGFQPGEGHSQSSARDRQETLGWQTGRHHRDAAGCFRSAAKPGSIADRGPDWRG